MNRLAELISLLRSLDVKIWVEGENLRLSAPPNRITAELRQELVLHKTELIDFIREATRPVDGFQPAIRPQPHRSNLPLSFMQEQLWFIAQMEPESPMYNVPQTFRLRGPLNFSALQTSLDRVITRHEILRTIFTSQHGRPAQVVLPPQPFTLHRVRSTDWQAWLRTEINRPFNLEHGPILRAALLELASEEHLLFINIHHIATDGWSDSIFLREVSANYTALLAGQETNLPPLPIQYGDFAAWHREWLQGEILNSQVNYWRHQLHDLPAVLELPTDRPRPAALTYRGTVYGCAFPPELLKKIQTFSAQHGATPFMTLLAVFEVLLYRYSNQEKFAIGTPVATRTHAETASLIGLFINTLVLRADLGGAPTFLELLKKVRETCLGAYAHQDLPFEKLVAELNLVRDMSRSPLFQVMFVLQNTPASELVLPNLQVDELLSSTETSKFDLTFSITQKTDGDVLNLQYSTDLFEPQTIERMAGHYLRLLESILSTPEQKITVLPLLTDGELHQLLVEWNDTQVDYPQEKCVHEWFEAQVEQTPEALAVVFEDQTLTYRALNEKANRIAHYLRAYGVGPETCVGILVERSLEVIIALLGILKAGGAYLPLDPTQPAGRIGVILEEARPAIVITQTRFQNLIPESVPTLKIDGQWSEIADYPTTNLGSIAQLENLVYVLFTSGSTGHPKGVGIEHRQLSNYLNGIVRRLGLPAGAHYAMVSTFAADLGNTVLFPALCTGGTLYIISYLQALNPEALADYFRLHAIDCLKIVPSHLRALLNTAHPAAIPPRQYLVLGGEVLDWELVNRIRQLAPDCRILNHYGPTETTVGVLTYPVSNQKRLSMSSVPLGRPLDNAKMYVLDAWGQLTPVGVPGELYIGGKGVGRGYLNRPELTAERFLPNQFEPASGERLYKTGDLVRYLPDGNLEFIRRLDDQIKIRGFRIELGEIESVLSGHPEVQANVVVAREDISGEKRLVAYVVLRKEDDSLTPSHLREYLKEKLPDYMVPGIFMLLKQLPLTSNGKIDRKALPKPDSEPWLSSAEFVPPQTPTEQILADIWANLLRVQRVGRHDNFFELGGDSISSLQFISRAQAQGLHLTPRQVFEAQTIDALAQMVEPLRSVQVEQGLIVGSVPLTPVQLCFFEHHPVNPQLYSQSVLLITPQRVELTLLSQTVEFLLNHHDALRLCFEFTELGWRQELLGNQMINDLITQVDLSELSASEQQIQIEAINAELQASLKIHTGPLLRLALFDFGAERPQELLIIIHYLVIDPASWQILVSDLWTAYAQFAQNHPQKLPEKSNSFKAWAEWLSEYAYQEELLDELPYWLELGQQPIQPLPIDRPGQTNQTQAVDRIEVTLSEAETEILLREVVSVYHTQVDDLLLTALTQAFCAWTGKTNLLIALENLGREAKNHDFTRTVGRFTSVFPVCLRLEVEEPGALIKSIKEQLRRLPQKGRGYGVLRYLNQGTASQLAALPQAEVCFHYYGQMKSTPVRVAESQWVKDGALDYLFSVTGIIVNHRLILTWFYDQNLYRRETVENLAQAFLQALNGLIAHCQSPQAGGYTPSDFPLAALSQPELDRLLVQGKDIVDIYPLSPLQTVMLSQSLAAPKSGIYFNQNSFQLSGDLDVPRFKAAWQELVNRHTILRTSFAWQGLSAPVQIVHQKARLVWDEQDWRGMSFAEQTHRLEKLLQVERQTGFDLTQVPLPRCTLLRVEAKRYWFVWHCHHLLRDGWSSPLLIRDVLDFYTDPSLTRSPARPYRDYIAWLNEQSLSKAEIFWRERLHGFIAPTALPEQKTWKLSQTGDYAKANITLSPTLSSALQALAQRQHLTLNTLCQGAWALLLHQSSGKDDLVFGVTVSGRSAPLPEVELRVGLFMNTLPLRVKIALDLPWDRWLQGLMQEQNLLEQYAYTSLEQIKTWAGILPDQMLFLSNLRFQNFPSQEIVLRPEDRFKIEDFLSVDWWHYPINLIIIPGSELELMINYDVCCFEPHVIRQILQKLAEILSHFTQGVPGESLSAVLPGNP